MDRTQLSQNSIWKHMSPLERIKKIYKFFYDRQILPVAQAVEFSLLLPRTSPLQIEAGKAHIKMDFQDIMETIISASPCWVNNINTVSLQSFISNYPLGDGPILRAPKVG